jgi:glutaminase
MMAAELADSHTINPFVNQGAMATTSMMYKDNKKEFFKDILDNMCAYANRRLPFGEKVYRSESKTNSRNLALAYLLKSYDRFYGDNVQKSVDVYTKQCSVMINSDDLATMAAVFATGGVHPETKQRLLGEKETDFILHTLRSEGLYQYSDMWTAKSGVPAKSGVGGGLLIIIPGICGIGIVSPPLDKYGNSVRGIAAGLEIVNSIRPRTFSLVVRTCKLIPNSRRLLRQSKKPRTKKVRNRIKKV